MQIKPCFLSVLILGFACLRSNAQVVETHAFNQLNRRIPDGDWSGLSDVHTVNSAIARITNLRVRLHIIGEFNGDLYCYLRHLSSGATNFCVLLNRVGRTSANPIGYSDAGFDVEFDDLAANGNIHTYQTIITPISGAPLTGAWKADGRRVNPGTVLDTSPVTTALSNFNGTSANGQWTLFLADLDMGATNLLASWEMEIAGTGASSVNWPAPADIVYGTPLGTTQLNASSSVPGTFAYTPPANTILNAGFHTLRVIFTPTDTVNYLSSTSSVSLNVIKKALLVTAQNTNKVYGAQLPPLGLSYTGLVNGDTTNNLTTQPVVSTTATASSPVGAYPISASGAFSTNYTITYVAGTLTVEKASAAGALNASQNPVRPGVPVSLTMNLTAVAPGAGTPTGLVQFRIDGLPAGSPAALSGGTALYTTATLPVGTHTVTAEYAGDPNFTGTTNSLGTTLLVNTPPVAGPDTIERSSSNQVKVALATLLSNDLDADGDAVTLASLSTVSVGGGTVRRSGDWIIYAPPAGSTEADSFTYSISDNRGPNVTGTVFIVVTTSNAPTLNLTIKDRGNGYYELVLDGVPGVNYRVEYCTDLDDPIWQPLSQGSPDGAGLYFFLDDPPGGSTARYYRAVYP